jgi:hypothetical protein
MVIMKPKKKKSLAEQAAALAAKAHKLKEPLVMDCMEALAPKSGMPLYLFRVVSSANANGPAHTVILNERGEAVKASRKMEALFDRTVLTTAGPIPASPTITIQPDTNTLTLNPGDTIDETITVTIPKHAGPAKADVYFLADTTGSMGSILNAVQAGANNVLAALSGLGVDMAFGVGNYRDFAAGGSYAFQHQVSPTNVAATVTAAITAWSATGGGDIPEGELFAFDSLAVPPGGTIGWRAGSKRIIVWFGDAPGHDPICTAVSGAPTITEATATAKLVAQGITVLAISTANPGLDGDPKAGATDYVAQCGPPGGMPGQGTRIATNTGGAFVTGINAGNIVNTIINLVTGAVSGIQNVKLVPSASIAPFVTSISPLGGYGPLAGDQDHTLRFDIKFTGIPCKPEAQVITGTMDVVADGIVVASKKVQITIPPCRPKLFVYSVKFICGVQAECGCECASVQPGRYATEINIHNYSSKEVAILKRFVPVVLAGAPVGREPRAATTRAEDKIILPPHTATLDDCCRIAVLLFGADGTSSIPLTIGILEITANTDIAVTAVYTTSGLKSGGVSIAVEQVAGQQQ